MDSTDDQFLHYRHRHSTNTEASSTRSDSPESCADDDDVKITVDDTVSDVTRATPASDEKYTLTYQVDVIPPVHIALLFALQQLIANVSAPVAAVYLVHDAVCGEGNQLLYAQMINTSFFMIGTCTILQITLGCRLPILQGSSFTYIAPILAMMSSDEWKCPEGCDEISPNITESPDFYMREECQEPWLPRLCEISGGLICASLVQMLLGCSGAIGFLMNYIGPLTIVPSVMLVGLGLFESATESCKHSWAVAFFVLALYFIFGLILRNIAIPLPYWNREKHCHTVRFHLFRLLPNLLSIGFGWLLCYILTITNAYPDDETHRNYYARTDAKEDVTGSASWFFFPIPFQWGLPTFGAGIFVGMLAGTISSIIESIGDYYATAKICQTGALPKHAVNRGVAMEGLGSLFSGIAGAGHATTSYSETVGHIGVTGVASRIAWILTGVMFILCGVIGKIGAALAIIPDPVIGGAMIYSLAMIVSVGLLPMQYLELRSSRNLLILGTAIILGMMLPFYLSDNPDAIDTGIDELDQVIYIFFSTGACVGGVLGFTLDNLIPGKKEERGIRAYQQHLGVDKAAETNLSPNKIYDLPCISDWLRKHVCCSYVPFLPSYFERPCCRRNCKCCGKTCKCCSSADDEQNDIQNSDDTSDANIEQFSGRQMASDVYNESYIWDSDVDNYASKIESSRL